MGDKATEADREALRRLFAIPGLQIASANPAAVPASTPASTSTQSEIQRQPASGRHVRDSGDKNEDRRGDVRDRQANDKQRTKEAAAIVDAGESVQHSSSSIVKAAAAKPKGRSKSGRVTGNQPNRYTYTRETLLRLRDSPLSRNPPPGNRIAEVLNRSRSRKRNQGNSSSDREHGGKSPSLARSQVLKGSGRGQIPARGAGSAAFSVGFVSDLGKSSSKTPHAKSSDRNDALRSGRGSRKSRAHHEHERGRFHEEEELPEWANVTIQRDDMMILGGLDDIDDSDLPDFFKKASDTDAKGGLLEDLENCALEGPLESSSEDPPAPVQVDETSFFGTALDVSLDGGDPMEEQKLPANEIQDPKRDESVDNNRIESVKKDRKSKFSRFFVGEDEDEPTEADIPITPWAEPASTDRKEPATSIASIDHSTHSKDTDTTDTRPKVEDATLGAERSVEDDRASIMRLFGTTVTKNPATMSPVQISTSATSSTVPAEDSNNGGEKCSVDETPCEPAVMDDPSRIAFKTHADKSQSIEASSIPPRSASMENLPNRVRPQDSSASKSSNDALNESVSASENAPSGGSNSEAVSRLNNDRDSLAVLLGKAGIHPVNGTTNAKALHNSNGDEGSSPTPNDESKVKVSRSFMPTSVIRKIGKGRGRASGRRGGGRHSSSRGGRSQGRTEEPAQTNANPTGLSASQANIMRLFGSGFQ